MRRDGAVASSSANRQSAIAANGDLGKGNGRDIEQGIGLLDVLPHQIHEVRSAAEKLQVVRLFGSGNCGLDACRSRIGERFHLSTRCASCTRRMALQMPT